MINNILLDNTIDIRDKYNNKGEYLKLIYVGDRSYDRESASHVLLCYFQPWLLPQNSPLNSPIITRAINIYLAGSLICGSLWVDSLELSRFEYHDNSESQVFELGTRKVSAVLLKNIINPVTLVPEAFWLTKGNTWVICVELYEKNIIIPYFELLRILFYQASNRLTRFFFSFLPLDSLCRPIISPKEENSWYGAFYVSSVKLSSLEARVLGGLLFDQALKNIFDLSQTHWLFPDFSNTIYTSNACITKPVGNLEISTLFNANGYNFTHNNDKYFWVNSLEMINSPYNFHELLFHPIQRAKHPSLNINTLPLCSDLLSSNINSKRLPKLHRCFNEKLIINKYTSVSDSISKETIKRARLLYSPFPYIMCGLPWAIIPIGTRKLHWLDETLAKQVVDIKENLVTEGTVHTDKLSDILNEFKKSNYSIEYLTLNNPDSFFGESISVFPINKNPPSPINIYRNNVNICIIASVKLTYGIIFFVQPYPKDNPELIILCQKQNLSIPDQSEWNSFLDIITPIRNPKEFYEFFKKVRGRNRSKVPTNSALIAVALPSSIITEEFCISFSNHILSRFIKRLQFYLASVLRYPNGMTNEQRNKVSDLSANICRTPNSSWSLKIFGYWSKVV